MKNFMTKLVAKLSVLALMATSLFAFSPVHAGVVTATSDTMSTQKAAATTVTHSVSMLMPSASTGTITLTYTGFSSLTTITSATCSTSGSAADGGTATTVVDIDLTACLGTLTFDFTATNPSASDVVVAIAGLHTGSFTVSIVDDDQVTVSATVAQTMTFDIDVVTADGDSATEDTAPYAVAFGTLGVGVVDRSGDGQADHIYLDLNTNASSGAVIQVKNANGANGLLSASTSDNINSLSGSNVMAAGTENYGLCVINDDVNTTTALAAQGDYATGTCTTNGATNAVVGFSTTFADLLSKTDGAINANRSQLGLSAAISTITAAHDDYADTITFRATATF